MGARAYRYLSLYDPSPGCLVEIGSERGEGSTAFLAWYAKRHKLRFYTADVDPNCHQTARAITTGARLARGAEFLRRLRTPISVAYMDGFDWIPTNADLHPWIEDQRRRYYELGYELRNDYCQQEHLREAELIAGLATERCAVIVDDTWLEEDRWTGKGGLAVPHLEREGFGVVDHGECEEHSLGFVVMRR